MELVSFNKFEALGLLWPIFEYDEPPKTPCKSSDDDSDPDRLNIDEGQGTILVTIDNTKPGKESKNNRK